MGEKVSKMDLNGSHSMAPKDTKGEFEWRWSDYKIASGHAPFWNNRQRENNKILKVLESTKTPINIWKVIFAVFGPFFGSFNGFFCQDFASTPKNIQKHNAFCIKISLTHLKTYEKPVFLTKTHCSSFGTEDHWH